MTTACQQPASGMPTLRAKTYGKADPHRWVTEYDRRAARAAAPRRTRLLDGNAGYHQWRPTNTQSGGQRVMVVFGGIHRV
jgi:hypothetical protein